MFKITLPPFFFSHSCTNNVKNYLGLKRYRRIGKPYPRILTFFHWNWSLAVHAVSRTKYFPRMLTQPTLSHDHNHESAPLNPHLALPPVMVGVTIFPTGFRLDGNEGIPVVLVISMVCQCGNSTWMAGGVPVRCLSKRVRQTQLSSLGDGWLGRDISKDISPIHAKNFHQSHTWLATITCKLKGVVDCCSQNPLPSPSKPSGTLSHVNKQAEPTYGLWQGRMRAFSLTLYHGKFLKSPRG